MDKRTRDEAVAWARDQLREVFRILAMIENDVTQEVSDILEHVEELDRLAKVDRSWVTEARKRRRIVEEELRRAFLAGLAPDGTERHSPSPYVRHLQEMAKRPRAIGSVTTHFASMPASTSMTTLECPMS